MAISDEIKEQTVKLKDMNRQEKIDYIWTYYKWWFIIGFAVIFVIVSLTKSIIQNSKPVYLNAVFLNSKNASSLEACPLEDEFLNSVGVEQKKYNVGFDYVTALTDYYADQAAYAGQVKLMSLYSSNEIDVLTGSESILSGPGDVGGYAKLDEVLPASMIEELKNKGYEFYYYTEKIYEEGSVADEDGNRPYTDGETYMAGIYIDNCPTLVGTSATSVYNDGDEDRPVLAIAWNSNNIDHAIEFINFVTK